MVSRQEERGNQENLKEFKDQSFQDSTKIHGAHVNGLCWRVPMVVNDIMRQSAALGQAEIRVGSEKAEKQRFYTLKIQFASHYQKKLLEIRETRRDVSELDVYFPKVTCTHCAENTQKNHDFSLRC